MWYLSLTHSNANLCWCTKLLIFLNFTILIELNSILRMTWVNTNCLNRHNLFTNPNLRLPLCKYSIKERHYEPTSQPQFRNHPIHHCPVCLKTQQYFIPNPYTSFPLTLALSLLLSKPNFFSCHKLPGFLNWILWVDLHLWKQWPKTW